MKSKLLSFAIGTMLCLGVVSLGAHSIAAFADTITLTPPVGTTVLVPAPDQNVVIEWGNMVADAALFLLSISSVVVAFLIRHLPAQWVSVILTARLDQALQKGIDFALNTVAGAAKGKQVSVKVANDVIRTAAMYLLQSLPTLAIKWAGGVDGLRNKIIARLDLEPGAVAVPLAPAAAGVVNLSAAASILPLSSDKPAIVPLMIVHEDDLKRAA